MRYGIKTARIYSTYLELAVFLTKQRPVFFSLVTLFAFTALALEKLEPKNLKGGDGSPATAMAISPDERVVAAGLSGRGAYVWFVEDSLKYKNRFLSESLYFDAMDVDNQGNILIGAHSYVGIWSIKNGIELREELTTINGRIISIKFGASKDEAIIIYAQYKPYYSTIIELWNIVEKRKISALNLSEHIEDIELSPDRTKFITSCYDTNSINENNVAKLYDSRSLKLLSHRVSAHNRISTTFDSTASSVGFLSHYSGIVAITDSNLKEIKYFFSDMEKASAIAFHPNGESLWIAKNNQTLELRSFKNSEARVWAWPYKTRSSVELQFGRSAKHLLSANDSEGLQWWKLPY